MQCVNLTSLLMALEPDAQADPDPAVTRTVKHTRFIILT